MAPPNEAASGRCLALVLQAAGRAMTLQDFNPRSRTYGCCDRAYWQERTVRGFPAATMQQLALPFAILHGTPMEGNPHAGDPALLERAAAAMDAWCAAQHRDGSLDEWYRNEHSYCATAFTAFAVGETLLRLRDRLDGPRRERIAAGLGRAAGWLERRFNDEVANQNLAACAALLNVARLTGERRWRQAFQEKWRATAAQQDAEGWFNEYGGADPGYATLALDLLACLHAAGAAGEAQDAASRMCRWLVPLAGAAGGLAGRLGSRGTGHAFPFGAAYFAPMVPEAARLAAHLGRGLECGDLPVPADADDRYLAYFYLPQFALAATARASGGIAAGGAEPFTSWPRSGFVAWRAAAGDLVVSMRRQGAFNLCVPGRPEHCNMGYWAQAESGARWASAAWNRGELDLDPPAAHRLRVRGRFAVVADTLPLARSMLPFTLFSEVALRWPAAAARFKAALKARVVARRREAPLSIERTIQSEGGRLQVTDLIRALPGCPRLAALGPADDTDTVSPSAHISPRRRWTGLRASEAEAREWAQRLGREGALTLRVVYAPDASGRLAPGPIAAGAAP